MKKQLNLEEAIERIKEINIQNIGWIPAVKKGIRGHMNKKVVVRYKSVSRKEQFIGGSHGKLPWIHLSTIKEILEIVQKFKNEFIVSYNFAEEYLVISTFSRVLVSNGDIAKSEALLKFSVKEHCDSLQKIKYYKQLDLLYKKKYKMRLSSLY